MLSGAASDAVHSPLAPCHEVVRLKPTTGVISSVAVMLNAPHSRCCWTHCSLRIRRFACARHTSDDQQFGSRITNDKFECISRRRSAWCTKAELSDRADSETPRRLPHADYVLHRAGCSQEDDQLLRKGWQWHDSRRGHDPCHAF